MENKEPFEFISEGGVRHIIREDDIPNKYIDFVIQLRKDSGWVLLGKIVNACWEWDEIEIGEISISDLQRFIEWARTDNGTLIVEIRVQSDLFDIFKEIAILNKKSMAGEDEEDEEIH